MNNYCKFFQHSPSSSSGYKNAFDEFAKFIMEKYPEVTVEGLPYPPPSYRKIGAQLIVSDENIIMYYVVHDP